MKPVLYVFRKHDLRLCDNRAILKARSFGLPVCFVAALDRRGEWERKNSETKLLAVGPYRRRFYRECFDDLNLSLRNVAGRDHVDYAGTTDQVADDLLYISELDLPALIEAVGDRFQHVVCSRERGVYEERAEKSALRAAKNKKVNFHVVTDDTLVAEENFPFRPLDGTGTAEKKPVLKDQYTSFRQVVEQVLQKDKTSGTVPAREFVRQYCPAVAASLDPEEMALAFRGNGGKEALPRCFSGAASSTANGSRMKGCAGEGDAAARLRVVSLAEVFGPTWDTRLKEEAFWPVTSPDRWEKLFQAAAKDSPLFPDSDAPDTPTPGLLPPKNPYNYAGGERAALARLQDYLWATDAVATYKKTRSDSLGKYFSTKFSMYTATGTLSPRTIVHELSYYEQKRHMNESTYWVVFELLWRDFLHFALQKHGKYFFLESGLTNRVRAWDNDWGKFQRWIKGQTGFPFVDAQMRELKATGFMSNRGRQNVASFLVFTLKIDWRWGAEYFEHVLLDHDVAANYGNWITIAGVGFQTRDNVFNVVKQSKQYESGGEYMKFWLPELGEALEIAASDATTRKFLLHTPWEVVDSRIRGCLPTQYQRPIVDAKKTFYYDKHEEFHPEGRAAGRGSGRNGNKGGGGKESNKGGGKRDREWKPNGFHGMEHHDAHAAPGDSTADDRPTSKRTKWRQKQ